MPDLVIPFTNSPNQDKELRYALRSIERYIPFISGLYIIGDTPKIGLKGVNLIPYKREADIRYRNRNIFEKLLLASNHPCISDSFISHDDDIFLLDYFNYKYYHKGQKWGVGTYAIVENNTRKLFPSANNFNVHYPRLFNKKLFRETVGTLNWKLPHGYSINTAYAAMNNFPGEEIDDLKFKSKNFYEAIKNLIKDRHFFSVSDVGFKPPLIDVLNEIYPNKSKYEKD
jgi:hypothetical protein